MTYDLMCGRHGNASSHSAKLTNKVQMISTNKDALHKKFNTSAQIGKISFITLTQFSLEPVSVRTLT